MVLENENILCMTLSYIHIDEIFFDGIISVNKSFYKSLSNISTWKYSEVSIDYNYLTKYNKYKHLISHLKLYSRMNTIFDSTILLQYPNIKSLEICVNETEEYDNKKDDIYPIADAEFVNTICELYKLANLKIFGLNIETNKNIDKLQNLVSFSIAGRNKIDDDCALQISKLIGLKELYIGMNDITQTGMDYLCNLVNLESLNTWMFGEQNITMTNIGKMKCLKKISCYSCGPIDAGYISELPSLIHLDLFENSILDEGMNKICNMASLRHLEVRSNNITDDGIKNISNIKKLKYLNLTYNDITHIGAKYISEIKYLTVLKLEGAKVGDVGIEYLSKKSIYSVKICLW